MGSDDHQAHPGMGLEPVGIEEVPANTFESFITRVYFRFAKGRCTRQAIIIIPAAVRDALKMKHKDEMQVAIRRPPK